MSPVERPHETPLPYTQMRIESKFAAAPLDEPGFWYSERSTHLNFLGHRGDVRLPWSGGVSLTELSTHWCSWRTLDISPVWILRPTHPNAWSLSHLLVTLLGLNRTYIGPYNPHRFRDLSTHPLLALNTSLHLFSVVINRKSLSPSHVLPKDALEGVTYFSRWWR